MWPISASGPKRTCLSSPAPLPAGAVRARPGGSVNSGVQIDADIGEPHPQLGGDIFGVFRQQQAEGPAARPPRFVAPFVADHGERDQRDVRHRVRQFDDSARHMIVRRHHDQRFEAALADPAASLGGVAAGIDGGAVEIDATAEQLTGCPATCGRYRSRHWSGARRISTAVCHSRPRAIPLRPTPATNRRSTPRCRRRCGKAFPPRRAIATGTRRSRRRRRRTGAIAGRPPRAATRAAAGPRAFGDLSSDCWLMRCRRSSPRQF